MASKPHKATPSSIPHTRPSTAIQSGADRLVELVELEKAHLTQLYHGALRGLEVRHKKTQEDYDVQLRSVDRKLQQQEKQIQNLTAEVDQPRAHATSVTADLNGLRVEHDALKASLSDVGLVYIDGRLQFDDKAARIVDKFMTGAKIQQDALLSSRLGGVYTHEQDDALSGPVEPTEFFDVLSEVIEKGRRFAEILAKHQQSESKPNNGGAQSGPAPVKQDFSVSKDVSLVASNSFSNSRKHAHSVLSDATKII